MKKILFLIASILFLFCLTTLSAEANQSPEINNIQVSGNQGNVTITFDLWDGDSDKCSIKVYYSGGSAGETWTSATVGGQTNGLVPGNSKSLVWYSAIDESGQKGSDYQLKLIANDNCGAANSPSAINNIKITGTWGDVAIHFDLDDWDGDSCSIKVHYKGGSAGSEWKLATISGPTADIPPGHGKVLIWHSAVDEPEVKASDYQLKIVANDNCGASDNLLPLIDSLTASGDTIYDDSSVTFSWSAVDEDGEIAGYYISLDSDVLTRFTTSTQKLFKALSLGDHTFYVMAKDNYGGHSEKVSKTITVIQKPVTNEDYGQLLLVLGGPTGPYDNLWNKLSPLADKLYHTFTNRGFHADDVYYMRVVEGDANPEVDDISPTVNEIQSAITDWAANSKNSGPLFICLLDHASSNGVFYVGPTEHVTASQLKAYVDTFISQSGRPVVGIMEACYSGVFLQEIASSQTSFISSSSAEKQSWITKNVSFTTLFNQMLNQGFTFIQSFENAKLELKKFKGPIGSQDPQLADSSNLFVNLYVVDDSVSMRDVFPAFSLAKVDKPNPQGGQQVCIEVDLIGSVDQISHVWAVITPPDFIPPVTVDDDQAPDLDLPKLQLTKDFGNRYQAYYNDFTKKGEYQVVIMAKNAAGDVGISESFTVTISEGSEPGVFNADLKSGWNLISLPIEPQDGTVQSIIAGISDNVISVWKWQNNNWQTYLPGQNTAAYAESKGFGILSKLLLGEGFWVNIASDDTINVFGEVEENPEISLSAGWNLVGRRKCGPAMMVKETFDPLKDEVLSVWRWTGDTWAVYLPGQNTDAYAQSKGFDKLGLISSGTGFWVNCIEPVSLEGIEPYKE